MNGMRWFAMFALGICLSGCASMRPLPLQEPTDATVEAYPGGGLNPATTPGEVKTNLKVYADTYLKHADTLRSASYSASDVSFSGGLLGIVGGLTRSPETAIAGALLNGSGSTAQARYEYQIQASNYERAAEALYCMRRHLYPYPGVIDISLANERIDAIRRKLRTVQSQVTLAATNADALKAALEKAIPAEKLAADAKTKMVEIRQDIEKASRVLELRRQGAEAAEKAELFERAHAESTKARLAAENTVRMREAVDQQEAIVSDLQVRLDSLAAGQEVRDEVETQMGVCAEKF